MFADLIGLGGRFISTSFLGSAERLVLTYLLLLDDLESASILPKEVNYAF